MPASGTGNWQQHAYRSTGAGELLPADTRSSFRSQEMRPTGAARMQGSTRQKWLAGICIREIGAAPGVKGEGSKKIMRHLTRRRRPRILR